MQFAQLPRIATLMRRVGLAGGRAGGAPAEGAAEDAADWLPDADDILLDIAFASRRELFARIGRHMEYSYDVDRDEVAQALEERERAGSTALGRGVAVPQARVPGLGRVRSMYLRLERAIEFDAPDGRPVSDVFVLLLPGAIAQRHIDTQVHVAQLFADDAFRGRLHACGDAAAALQVLQAEVAELA